MLPRFFVNERCPAPFPLQCKLTAVSAVIVDGNDYTTTKTRGLGCICQGNRSAKSTFVTFSIEKIGQRFTVFPLQSQI
ncbi:hypothetical protein NDU88_005779 [Pleurodeles waltl]|uniref:Uncharacterized protein n=1 Tax=Pleurodeles waltl TaxID=8319 RepID=A0AAV7MFN7_PLEWA|nr:hypothetical protein NDU88_005779 [Pleurodeles waltl]